MTQIFDRRATAILLAMFLAVAVAVCGWYAGALSGGEKRSGFADLVRYRPDLNSATQDELNLLPEITPRQAAAIVAHRQAGPFAGIEELADVRLPGGKAAFDAGQIAKLKGLVTVNDRGTRTGNAP